MFGGFAQHNAADGQQDQTLQSITLAMPEERACRLLHYDRRQHHEKQRHAPNRVHSCLLRLCDQQSQQQEKREMQTHLCAKEPADRNGPSANQ